MTDGFDDNSGAEMPKAKAPLGVTPLSRLEAGKPKKLVPMVGGLAILVGLGAAGYMYVSSMGAELPAPVTEAPAQEQVATAESGMPPMPDVTGEAVDGNLPVVDPSLATTVDPVTGVPMAMETVPAQAAMPLEAETVSPDGALPDGTAPAMTAADPNTPSEPLLASEGAAPTVSPAMPEADAPPTDMATTDSSAQPEANMPELPAPAGLPLPQGNEIDEAALGMTPETDNAIPLEAIENINAPSLPPMPDVGEPTKTITKTAQTDSAKTPEAVVNANTAETALAPPVMEEDGVVMAGQDPLAQSATPPGPSAGQTDQLSSEAQAEAALRELANQAEAAYIRPLPRGFLVLEAEQRASSSEAVMASASRKLSSGDYKGALAIYDELYATSPNDVRIMMGRAIALQKSGRADEALMAYEQVLNFQPSNLDALTNMIGLLAQQNPSLASSKLEALRKTYPANAKIAAQYGVAQSKLGNLQVALDAFSQAIKIEGGNAYYNYSRAVVLDKMGRRSEAAAEYRAALDLNRAGRTSQAIPVEAIQNRLAVL